MEGPATRSRRTDAYADARSFAADEPCGVLGYLRRRRSRPPVDFPAFLCRIRGFPAVPWPDIRVAEIRVGVQELPV